MASAVVSDNFETSGGGVPQLGGTGATTCKAWVNFNGTGTVAIRDSYNVSSITDLSTGKYTVNFTNGFSNNNYSAVYIAGMFGNSIDDRMATVWYLRSNAFNVACGDNSDNSYYDCDYNGVQVFSN